MNPFVTGQARPTPAKLAANDRPAAVWIL